MKGGKELLLAHIQMKVVICEDNKMYAERIESNISKYAMIEDNNIHVLLNTPYPKEVVQLIETEEVDCFFLDIDLGDELSGLDLAKIIRKKLPLASIIFVTTHEEMQHLVFKYKVEALDYIIKDKDEDAVVPALKSAFEKYRMLGKQDNLKMFQIEKGEYTKNVKIDDILYFKASDAAHRVHLITVNGEYEFSDSLNKIEDVDESFFRSHKSYIVNKNNIEEVNWKNKIIIMKNKEECPISFRKVKQLRDILAVNV